MKSPVSELIELLSLERLEDNLFRGQSRDIGTKYVFGGQVLGQALSAAQATMTSRASAFAACVFPARRRHRASDRVPRRPHPRRRLVLGAARHRGPAWPGDLLLCGIVPGTPGRRRAPVVDARSTQPEDIEPSAALPPGALAKLPTKVQRWLSRMGPFEFRHVYPRDELDPPKRPPFQQVWFRLGETVGDAPELHRALLAYASDFHLLGTATFPHGISYYQPNVQMASLDHALWFHRPFRADEWLLYAIDSPRHRVPGLARPSVRSRRPPGRHTVQEGCRVAITVGCSGAFPAKDGAETGLLRTRLETVEGLRNAARRRHQVRITHVRSTSHPPQ